MKHFGVYPSCASITQLCHFSMAVAMVFIANHYGVPPGPAMWIVVFWAVAKEGIWDIWTEPDTVLGSVTDAIFYLTGALAAGVLLAITG